MVNRAEITLSFVIIIYNIRYEGNGLWFKLHAFSKQPNPQADGSVELTTYMIKST